MWNILKLNEFYVNEMEMIEYVIKIGILKGNNICTVCNSEMQLKKIKDSCYWRCRKVTLINCRKVQCEAKESITKDTFFYQSHLPLQKILLLLYMLIKNYDQIQIIDELELNKNTKSMDDFR